MDNNKKLYIIAAVLIISAAFSRLIPHPPNVTPITAIALFSAVYIKDLRVVYALPLAALLISDLLLMIFQGVPMGVINLVVYASFSVIVLLGLKLKEHFSGFTVVTTVAAGSLIFFLITNFVVWAGWNMYPKTSFGLLQCYVSAVPFLRNMFLGDLFYTGTLFIAYILAEKSVTGETADSTA